MRRWRPRWWELLPEGLVALGFGVFLLTDRSAALSAFKSRKAITLMVIAAAAWIAGRLLFARFVKWRWARAAVFIVAALGVLSIVVFPAYDDTTVVETF